MVEVETLKERMRKEPTEFMYTKKDGSCRTAIGTLDPELIEKEGGVEALPKNVSTPAEGTVPYFDLEKKAWRSFNRESLIEIMDSMVMGV